MSKTNNKRGFTLIELLVVISIIGLLSSVVLVSLNSARTKARDTARISAIRQVTSALELYKSKYNTYPISTTIAASEDGWISNQSCDEFISHIVVNPMDVIPGISEFLPDFYKFGSNLGNIANSYGCLYYKSDGVNYKFSAVATIESMCPLGVSSLFADPLIDNQSNYGRCALSISTPSYKDILILVP